MKLLLMGWYSKYWFSLFFLFLSLTNLLAQSEDKNKIDSLKQVLNKQQHDTSKVKVYVELGRLTRTADYDLSRSYLNKAEKLAQKNDFICEELYIQYTVLHGKHGNLKELLKYGNKGLSIFENNNPSSSIKIYVAFANFYADQSKVDSALLYYEKGLELTRNHGMKGREAGIISNIGAVYYESGKYSLASKYYIEAINLLEESDSSDKNRLASVKSNLAIIYLMQEDFDGALEILEDVLEINKQQKNYSSAATTLNNIAGVYVQLGKIEEALNPLEESAKYYEKSGYKVGEAFAYNNLGILTKKIGQSDKSLKYRLKSLEIYKSINNEIGVASAYLALATFYNEESNQKKALDYALKAEEIYNRIEKLDKQVELNLLVANIYKDIGLYEKSNDYLYKYVAIKDSLIDIEKNKSIAEMKERFEAEENEKKIALQEKELIQKEARNQKQQAKIYFIFIGLGVASLLSLLLILGYRQKSKSNKIISSQKELVEQKNKEILDSITYAKRLQEAILPSKTSLNTSLKNGFVLYKPKDVVSGDFYFLDVVEEKDKKLIYYVAADCTGHGVPGAMVSIVGANGLKRCIQEFDLRDPGEILDQLAEIVAENFAQSEERIRDGMDLALCCLEIEKDVTKKVHYAGANNPLWVINPSRTDIPEIGIPFKQGGGFEIKANKQAIGYTENITPFDTHTFDVKEGDTLYTFSDGYPDQFGGEKGKKYKSANFKKLLLDIYDKNMDDQKLHINEEFHSWKGDLEQVDDVCVIGVRL